MSEPVGRRRRRWGWWVLALAVLLVAVFAWHRHAGTMAQKKGGPPPQTVGVAKAVAGPMPVVLTALGTVTPTATVTVLPQLSGYLTQVAFTEGQVVQAGQFLAQIDPRPYEIQLEQYEGQKAKDMAALAQARTDLARYQLLQRQSSIANQTVADQQFLVAQDIAAIKIDQANIDSANLNLAYCHITAPVTGKVGLRLVDPGNYVTSGSSTGIAVITTITPITVIFSVAQNALSPVLVQVAQGAQLAAAAYSSDDTTKVADGTLTAVDNQVDTSTGMVKLRASYANADGALFPNEFVNVHLLVTTLQNATLVPSPAVQTGEPGTYVYLVKPDNTVTVRKVTVGPTDGTNTVITQGLQPGDTVVTDGVDRLAEGAKITVAQPGAAAPGAGDTVKGGGKRRQKRQPAD